MERSNVLQINHPDMVDHKAWCDVIEVFDKIMMLNDLTPKALPRTGKHMYPLLMELFRVIRLYNLSRITHK